MSDSATRDVAQLFEGTAAAAGDVDAALAVLEERSGRQNWAWRRGVEHEEAAQAYRYDRLGTPIGCDELGLGSAVGRD